MELFLIYTHLQKLVAVPSARVEPIKSVRLCRRSVLVFGGTRRFEVVADKRVACHSSVSWALYAALMDDDAWTPRSISTYDNNCFIVHFNNFNTARRSDLANPSSTDKPEPNPGRIRQWIRPDARSLILTLTFTFTLTLTMNTIKGFIWGPTPEEQVPTLLQAHELNPKS